MKNKLDEKKTGFGIKDLLNDSTKPDMYYTEHGREISVFLNGKQVRHWEFNTEDMSGVCVRYSEINSDGKKNTAKFYPKDNQIVAYDGDVKCTFKKGIFSYEQGKYVIEVTVDDGGIVGGVLKVNGEVRDSFSYQKPHYHSIDLGEKIAKFCSRNKDGATSEIISVFNKDMDTYQEKGDAMFWNRPTRRKISEKLSETIKRKDVAYNSSSFSEKTKRKLTFWF